VEGENKKEEKKTDEKHEEKHKKPKSKQTVVAAFAIIIVVIGLLAFLLWLFWGFDLSNMGMPQGVVAESGDTVEVLYTGSFENGDVFDTNIEEVGKASGIEKPSYEVFVFVLGEQQVIPGFEEAVEGMRVGEEKTVTVPAEKGYPYDPSLITVIPRVQEINREEALPLNVNLTAQEFLFTFGMLDVGDKFTPEGSTVEYEVIEMTVEYVTSKLAVEIGETYTFPGMIWNSTVMGIDDENVTIRHDPEEGIIDTAIGTAELVVTNDTLIINSNPDVGERVQTILGVLTVIDVNLENITLDMNHELAGKPLVFEITLVNVTKAE
jgi:FKBP-type peptidyl-prolyl cis-trans isomerase 2